MDHAFDMVIEIPLGGRNTSEFDHHRGVMRLDRRRFVDTGGHP